MLRTVDSILELIGNTPMIKLKRISEQIPAEIWAKLEFFNPTGSVKDRIGLKMIEEAEKRGKIGKGSTIIEPTSGNTGIALSWVCAVKGYKMIAVMPEVVSEERRMIMQLLGAKIEVVKCKSKEKGLTKDDMEKVVATAERLNREIPNSFIPNQFENEDNIKAHIETTAAEILEQTGGKLSAFVAACGTGGTFTGVAKRLKEKCPGIKNIVVEPSTSAVMSGCQPGYHNIQGIGEGFIPKVMHVDLADKIAKVSDEEAIETACCLWKQEGIMAGISSGANVFASLQAGKKMKEGDIIVTIIADTGLRYFSTKLFEGCKP